MIEAGKHAALQIVRRRRHLAGRHMAVGLVDGDTIGKGSPDIDGERVHGLNMPFASNFFSIASIILKKLDANHTFRVLADGPQEAGGCGADRCLNSPP